MNRLIFILVVDSLLGGEGRGVKYPCEGKADERTIQGHPGAKNAIINHYTQAANRPG